MKTQNEQLKQIVESLKQHNQKIIEQQQYNNRADESLKALKEVGVEQII